MAEPITLPLLSAVPEEEEDIRRERVRRGGIRFTNVDENDEKERKGSPSKGEIASRVIDFYEQAMRDRQPLEDAHLERYAKFRQYTAGKDWPWEGASDVAMPDLVTISNRQQDTIHNAIFSSRPVVRSRAIKKMDAKKQEMVDHIIDYQVFEEQNGDAEMSAFIEAFVNTPVATMFTPWVTEKRTIRDVRKTEPIPGDKKPEAHFVDWIMQNYPGSAPNRMQGKEEGWDWLITIESVGEQKREIEAHFYTTKDEVEVVLIEEAVRFDGPKVRNVEFSDLFHPVRCENLQAPGPSNPSGSAYVIMRSYPTIDEVKRLARSGFYDRISKEELDNLSDDARQTSDDPLKDQKDTLAGASQSARERDRTHGRLTLLTCFDIYDIDNDGITEDIIWWVLLEPGIVIKAEHLTELYPSSTGQRPFSEACYMPVSGLRWGVSLLELAEGISDTKKQVFDQMIDAGTITNSPFFFYRATSQVRPEQIRMWPGEGYPTADPQRDVHFPSFNNNSQAWGLNILTLLQQWEERSTSVTDLSLGRVPAGKSSALRTVGGITAILDQGEARPQRILRRFFNALTHQWKWIHQLNTHFLKPGKQYRISGFVKPNETPYKVVEAIRDIEGKFDFGFEANVLNTSKQGQIDGMEQLFEMLSSPLAIQLGVTSPDSYYRLVRDKAKLIGTSPERYMNEPDPASNLPMVSSEEALIRIIQLELPDGRPAEGAEAHLAELAQHVAVKVDGNATVNDMFNTRQRELFQVWTAKIGELAKRDKMLAEQQEAAAKSQGAIDGAATQGGGAAPPNMDNQNVEPNELLDEALPAAGGGGEPGA